MHCTIGFLVVILFSLLPYTRHYSQNGIQNSSQHRGHTLDKTVANMIISFFHLCNYGLYALRFTRSI
jgi:hypothetical protein